VTARRVEVSGPRSFAAKVLAVGLTATAVILGLAVSPLLVLGAIAYGGWWALTRVNRNRQT
jgi:hypothetical protein